MANFLLLYVGGSEPQDEAEGAAVMKAWTDWFTNLGPAVVDGGNPLGPVAKTISSGGRVSDGAAGMNVTGYSILKAGSLDEATQMAKKCPHLDAGGTVTVLETFPVM
jgi:hypothetical protein